MGNRKYDINTLIKIRILIKNNPNIYVRDLCKLVDLSVGSAYNYVRNYLEDKELIEINKKHRNRLQQSELFHYISPKVNVIDNDMNSKINNIYLHINA